MQERMTDDQIKMAQQATFDFVLAKLREQGQPSAEIQKYTNSYGDEQEEVYCRYRQSLEPHGDVRCAMGHLVPDEDYRPEWDEGDGTNASAIIEHLTFPDRFTSINVNPNLLAIPSEVLLDRLQRAHDDAAKRRHGDFLANLDKEMSQVASVFGLLMRVA